LSSNKPLLNLKLPDALAILTTLVSELKLNNDVFRISAQAAHLMVSSLAGSLALVTCKEPLRVSLSNQLRVLLQQVPQSGLDQAALEQTVQTIVNDNLEVRSQTAGAVTAE
jgi:hypothetical protein